jgi:hypothetical protein
MRNSNLFCCIILCPLFSLRAQNVEVLTRHNNLERTAGITRRQNLIPELSERHHLENYSPVPSMNSYMLSQL